jgi:succinate dehydrogenase / fumarate reductase, cytochrome b subunit
MAKDALPSSPAFLPKGEGRIAVPNMLDFASIFGRHEFAIRRLHSLTGIMPVGAFLFVHLVTNVSILDGPATYQDRVGQIHSIGPVTLLVVEWLFILLPILFHGLIGLLIVTRGNRNIVSYPYRENVRYALERWTGVVTFVFILWHVFHTRGWFTSTWWLAHVTKPLGGGTFDFEHAAASSAASIQASGLVAAAYLVGVLASAYHLSNGVWTAGITWGVWTSENAQRRATILSLGIGLVLATMGLAALVGMYTTTIP